MESTRENKKIDAIIQDELFKHLNKQQVVRRYNLYSAEKFLRKKYGTKFFKRTVEMLELKGKCKFIPMNILSILKAWRDFFLKINVYNSLPDHLEEFLLRCSLAFDKWSPEDEDNGLAKFLSPHDMARVESFMEYIKDILLPSYANTWFNYARIEVESPEKMNGKPDLFLADLELNLNFLRRSWVENSNSLPQRAFLEETFMIEVFHTQPLYQIYERTDDDGDIIFPPDFVEKAIEDKDLESLQRMLFSRFELNVWTSYISNIFVGVGMLDVEGDSEHVLLFETDIKANPSERDIIYYLVGASLRKAIGCLLTVPKQIASKDICTSCQESIITAVSLSKEEASKIFDPRELRTTSRRECTEKSFLYPNMTIYKLFVSIYESHIKSVLINPMTISLTKDQTEIYLEHNIIESPEFIELYELILKCCRQKEYLAKR